MRLRVIDIETTGGSPSEIIEIAAVDVVSVDAGWAAMPPRSTLFRPHGPINFHAMAIHHLTPENFGDDLQSCSEEQLKDFVVSSQRPDFLIAHNAAFESQHIPAVVTDGVEWFCTVKAARSIWPDAPGYSNQVLRYWRGLKLDPSLAMPPHRAGPDAWVPPIGAGRPFVDIIRLLREQGKGSSIKGFAELKIVRRQAQEADSASSQRDDVLLSRWFGGDAPDPGADEIWQRLADGKRRPTSPG